jgi:hypothetical protein
VIRQLGLGLVLLGMLVLGGSKLSAQTPSCTGTTTFGSFTSANGLLSTSWSCDTSAAVATPCPLSSSNQFGSGNCGYVDGSNSAYLNGCDTGTSPCFSHSFWHTYNANTSTPQNNLNGMYICGTGASCVISPFQFTLTGNATLHMGTPNPVNLYRAPANDNGWFLSTPDSSSSITIQFGSSKLVNNVWHCSGSCITGFDFYWGSVDTWNKVTFTDQNGNTTSFYGSDLGMCGISTSADGSCFPFTDPSHNNPGNPDLIPALIDFSPGGSASAWQSVTITSSDSAGNYYPAFELDNLEFTCNDTSTCDPNTFPSLTSFASSPTPEPSSVLLLGTSIAGISMLLRRRLRA